MNKYDDIMETIKKLLNACLRCQTEIILDVNMFLWEKEEAHRFLRFIHYIYSPTWTYDTANWTYEMGKKMVKIGYKETSFAIYIPYEIFREFVEG